MIVGLVCFIFADEHDFFSTDGHRYFFSQMDTDVSPQMNSFFPQMNTFLSTDEHLLFPQMNTDIVFTDGHRC